MKFTIQTILSMPIDGASSHLLIFNNSIKILLDCGISHQFKFDKYLQKAQQLKTVCLVLISHSQLQYSGALTFLIDELGMDPKIFYTTQSIIRYSPLNLHQSLLSLRSKVYSKKIFNKLYKIYQSINIIKPQQKKSINVGTPDSLNPNININTNINVPAISQHMQQQQKPTIGQVQKIIYFTCFSAGGNMGSLSWRLSFGIVNIVYLVQYNNYSMYHIDGIDLAQVIQPTDILITDCYKNIDDSWMKKTQLYHKIKSILLNFYQKNNMPFAKPPILTNIEQEKKILITCYPNQALVQVMAVTNKILQDMQSPQSRQKIRVIHLSSRFLQLIKSQMDYFSNYFKDTIQNIQQYFIHAKNISGRINLTTLQSLDSLVSQSIDKSVQIYHIGEQLKNDKIVKQREQGEQNILKFKIMTIDDKLIHSTSKINAQEDQKQQQLQKAGSQMSQQKQLTISQVPDQVQAIGQQVQVKANQPLHGKYLSRIGFFPRFVSKQIQQQDVFDQYGARHQYERFQQRKTIQSYKKQQQAGGEERLSLQKKQSTIQIMNIQFKTIHPDGIKIDYSKIPCIPFYSYRTNFNSSIQLILTIKPDNVILINTSSDYHSRDSIGTKYTDLLAKSHNSHSNVKKIDVYQLSRKNGICHLFIQNQLISYKVNYIPIPQQRKLQKVKGLITYSGKGLLYIHLDCLQQKQHLQFRLDKFYRKVKSLQIHQCVFTKNGIIIDGVRISRDEKRIILQGEYSQEYFKVRRLLYDFLKMQ